MIIAAKRDRVELFFDNGHPYLRVEYIVDNDSVTKRKD